MSQQVHASGGASTSGVMAGEDPLHSRRSDEPSRVVPSTGPQVGSAVSAAVWRFSHFTGGARGGGGPSKTTPSVESGTAHTGL